MAVPPYANVSNIGALAVSGAAMAAPDAQGSASRLLITARPVEVALGGSWRTHFA